MLKIWGECSPGYGYAYDSLRRKQLSLESRSVCEWMSDNHEPMPRK